MAYLWVKYFMFVSVVALELMIFISTDEINFQNVYIYIYMRNIFYKILN